MMIGMLLALALTGQEAPVPQPKVESKPLSKAAKPTKPLQVTIVCEEQLRKIVTDVVNEFDSDIKLHAEPAVIKSRQQELREEIARLNARDAAVGQLKKLQEILKGPFTVYRCQ